MFGSALFIVHTIVKLNKKNVTSSYTTILSPIITTATALTTTITTIATVIATIITYLLYLLLHTTATTYSITTTFATAGYTSLTYDNSLAYLSEENKKTMLNTKNAIVAEIADE